MLIKFSEHTSHIYIFYKWIDVIIIVLLHRNRWIFASLRICFYFIVMVIWVLLSEGDAKWKINMIVNVLIMV